MDNNNINAVIHDDAEYAIKSLEYGYKSSTFAWVPFLGLYYGIKGMVYYFKAHGNGDQTILHSAKIFNIVGILFLPILILMCMLAHYNMRDHTSLVPVPYTGDAGEFVSIIK